MAQRARPLYAHLGLTRLRSLQVSDQGLLVLLLLGSAVAGWQTLSSLLPYARGDTPLSFVALVPLLGAVYAICLFDAEAIRARYHDAFIDSLCCVVLLLAAGFLLLVLPVTMGWYYWLDRLDVPGLVLLLTALIGATWGVPAVSALLPAMLYLLLAWPLPWLFVDNHVLPLSTSLTTGAVRHIVTMVPLGISPDPVNASGVLVRFGGHTSTLVIGQACSGANGALGLMVLALPIAMLAQGHGKARAGWLTAGVVLSWLVNVLRVIVLVVGAALWGPHLTLTLLHPEIGLLFFGLSFALLLWLAPRFGLDLVPVWQRLSLMGRRSARLDPQRRAWSPVRLTIVTVLLIAGALAESNLAQFNWISDSSLPRVSIARASDLFRPPHGWHVISAHSLRNWTPFFGASSVASVMRIAARNTPEVDVQAVLTRDRSAFDAYSVENCYTFHGYTLKAVHRVSLGSGVTATLIDFHTKRFPLAALYWVQPVETPHGQYHRRVILIAGQHGAAGHALDVAREAPVQGVVQPVQAFATALADLFSPWLGSDAGPAYAASNAEARALGQMVVSEERRLHR